MLASSDREGVDSACRSMHNIDSVCIEAFSVTIHSRNLERATWSLGRLSGEVNRAKATEGARLQAEYRNLVNGLIEQRLLDGGGGGGGGRERRQRCRCRAKRRHERERAGEHPTGRADRVFTSSNRLFANLPCVSTIIKPDIVVR